MVQRAGAVLTGTVGTRKDLTFPIYFVKGFIFLLHYMALFLRRKSEKSTTFETNVAHQTI